MTQPPLTTRHFGARGAIVALTGAMALSAAAAVGLLIAQRGFSEPPASPAALEAVQLAAIAIFVGCKLATIWFAAGRAEYIRRRWFDFALVGVAAACVVLDLLPMGPGRVEAWAHLGVVNIAILQIYILAEAGAGVLRTKLLTARAGMPPAWMLVLGILALVVVGTFVLLLPAATTKPDYHYRTTGHAARHVLNCLFTATSASCVTGLTVYDTGGDFTRFGQWVILAMMQLGGLGMMVFGTLLAMSVGRKLAHRDAVGPETIGQVGRTVRYVVATTLAVEALGALSLHSMWPAQVVGSDRWFHSVFHSVSAFCNAGFSLQSDSLMRFRGQWQIYGTFMPLIVVGGLGFPVLQNLFLVVSGRLGRWVPRRREVVGEPAGLTLQSKLVLATTVVLLVVPTIGFVLLESPNRPAARIDRPPVDEPDLLERLGTATFLSASARTAGFRDRELESGSISNGSSLLLMVLMLIGGSPAGTAGGVKTVTIAVLLLSVAATLRGRERVEVFSRTIATDLVRRAMAVVMLFSCLVGAVTLALCVTEGDKFSDLLFESVSACATVGLSTGITHGLTVAGRIVLVVAMFAGRVGPLALLIALTCRNPRADSGNPEEAVIVA